MNALSDVKKLAVVTALVNGVGTHGIRRMTGAATPTICNLVRDLGAECVLYFDEHVRQVGAEEVQCDELWSYVGSKAHPVWIWIAMDPKTKLVITWRVGNRDLASGARFMADLNERLNGPSKITTDAHNVYGEALECMFHNHVVAIQGGHGEWARRRGVASTYAVERHNLTLRRSINRLARGTNGFSRSIYHLNAHVAIYLVYYNFCRLHKTLRVTPAMEAGLSGQVFSLTDLVGLHAYRRDGLDVLETHLDALISPSQRVRRSRRRDHREDNVHAISPAWTPRIVSSGERRVG